MLFKTYGGAVCGVDAAIITIEVNMIQGASFFLVGLPDNAIKESQFRIVFNPDIDILNCHKFTLKCEFEIIFPNIYNCWLILTSNESAGMLELKH